ncbi:hypothetical protein MSS93_05875 [Deinococcus radiodurans]|nr:hypothetical protein MSS93_05875 [Deinococcus radiodurans]
MSNTTQHRVHLLTSALALVTLLASCGGPQGAGARAAAGHHPRRLLRDGSVFFFITSRDHSGKG